MTLPLLRPHMTKQIRLIIKLCQSFVIQGCSRPLRSEEGKKYQSSVISNCSQPLKSQEGACQKLIKCSCKTPPKEAKLWFNFVLATLRRPKWVSASY